MIGVPLPNPRDAVIAELNQQIDSFFSSGKTAEVVPSGVSGELGGPIASTRSVKLRAGRDKDATQLKELAEAGMTVIEAAKVMGTETRRARLIALESGIKFADPS